MEAEFDQPSAPAEPVEPKREPRAEGFGGVQLLVIGLALIGSGAVMITVLSAGGSAPASTPAPRPAASAAATRTAGALEPVEGAPGWIENTNQWTPRTRRRVAFELPAVKDTQVWMKAVRPLLVVRCVQGEIESFVYTDSPATMEPEDEDHTVRLWFDGGNQQTERWPDSAAHDALFSPNGSGFVTQLMQARTFRFGYHPHNAAPVVAQFHVAGLREKLDASPACKGKRPRQP